MSKWCVKYDKDSFTEHLYDALVKYCTLEMPVGKVWYSYTKNTYEDFQKQGYFNHWAEDKEKGTWCGVDNNSSGLASYIMTIDALKALIGYETKYKDLREKSVVGTYLKALRDSPDGIDMKAGEYLEVCSTERMGFIIGRPETKWFFEFGSNWEVMPWHFSPNLIDKYPYKYPLGPIKIKGGHWSKYQDDQGPRIAHGHVYEGGPAAIVDRRGGKYLIEYTFGHQTMRLVWEEDDLEPIESKKAQSPYRIGDWCYVLDKGTTRDLQAGRIYQVNATNGEIFHMDSGNGQTDCSHWLKLGYIRLATKEDFLEEAKLRYPQGTTYRCASSNDYVHTVLRPGAFSIYGDTLPCNIASGPGLGMLFYNGKWAAIEGKKAPTRSASTLEIIRIAKSKFSIGSEVKSLVGFTDTVTDFNTNSYPVDGWNELDQQLWFSGKKYGMLVYSKGKWATRVDEVKVPDSMLDARKEPVSEFYQSRGIDSKLMAEAERLFPIGTRIRDLSFRRDEDVVQSYSLYKDLDGHDDIWFQGKRTPLLVYKKGAWATILDLPVKVKSTGFDEAEFLSRPFNQISPIETSSQIKHKQKRLWQK